MMMHSRAGSDTCTFIMPTTHPATSRHSPRGQRRGSAPTTSRQQADQAAASGPRLRHSLHRNKKADKPAAAAPISCGDELSLQVEKRVTGERRPISEIEAEARITKPRRAATPVTIDSSTRSRSCSSVRRRTGNGMVDAACELIDCRHSTAATKSVTARHVVVENWSKLAQAGASSTVSSALGAGRGQCARQIPCESAKCTGMTVSRARAIFSASCADQHGPAQFAFDAP